MGYGTLCSSSECKESAKSYAFTYSSSALTFARFGFHFAYIAILVAANATHFLNLFNEWMKDQWLFNYYEWDGGVNLIRAASEFIEAIRREMVNAFLISNTTCILVVLQLDFIGILMVVLSFIQILIQSKSEVEERESAMFYIINNFNNAWLIIIQAECHSYMETTYRI